MGGIAMNGRIRTAAATIGLALIVAIAAGSIAAQQESTSAPRGNAPHTLLQLNDVYSTVPIDGIGGLARVATLKQQLAAAGRTPFLVMAGDFLSPSVASSVFKGEQMIAALNATGLDLATLGNHEFDFGDDVLIERMREAKWQWIVAVTQLAFATDRSLVERFTEIDLIIGHEHFPITTTENRTLSSKAGSDARWVARIDVNRRPEGTLERFFELVPITSVIPDNPATAGVDPDVYAGVARSKKAVASQHEIAPQTDGRITIVR